MSKKVVLIGQGYVGLPVAIRAAEVGYNVIGLDLDSPRIEQLSSGISYIDDVSNERLVAAYESGRYRATTNYADAKGFDYAVITVPTPLRDSLPDLSFIEKSAESISQYVTPGATIVLESTTYPGTTEELLIPILEQGSGLKAGKDFFVGYSPERIDPGNKKYGFVETPKVVSGIDEASLAKVKALYDDLVERTVPVSGTKEAELTKLLENTFRHVNIALVNELAIFANQLDVDIWESIEAASTKPFGYMKFTPGPGVGGHCLPVDPSYLSWQVRRKLGQNFRFIELANDVNDHMPDYVVQRLMRKLNEHQKALNGSRILVIGLAYKKNSGDFREAPALKVLDVLEQLGAKVTVSDDRIDPKRWPASIDRVSFDAVDYEDFDAAVLITDHDELDFSRLLESGLLVLDTKNRLVGDYVERL